MRGRAEGDPPWRSTIAGASGLILVAYVIVDAHWSAAIYSGDDLSPDVVVNAFDLGNLGFANVWLAMASLAGAAARVSLTTRAFPAWLGWVAAASAVGLVAGRFVWTTNLWLARYALFWIWRIAVSILLIRRGEGIHADEDQPPPPSQRRDQTPFPPAWSGPPGCSGPCCRC